MTVTARTFIAQFRDDMRGTGKFFAEYRAKENRQMLYGTGMVLLVALIMLFSTGVFRPLAVLALAMLFIGTIFRVEEGEYRPSLFMKGVGRGLALVAFFVAFFFGLEWIALDGSI